MQTVKNITGPCGLGIQFLVDSSDVLLFTHILKRIYRPLAFFRSQTKAAEWASSEYYIHTYIYI
jgi:hypothetical protein